VAILANIPSMKKFQSIDEQHIEDGRVNDHQHGLGNLESEAYARAFRNTAQSSS
jgi:hypothetical protein